MNRSIPERQPTKGSCHISPLTAASSAWLLPLLFVFVFAIQPVSGQRRYDGPINDQVRQAINYLNLGMSMLNANDNTQALEVLTKAVALAPDLPEAHHNIALALAKLGRPEEAISHLKIALELNPNLSPALLTLGGLYQTTGQIERAMDTYRQYIKRFPKDSETPKLSNLVRGLENLSGKMSAGAATSPAPADGAREDSGSDYLAAVTKDGVFRWPQSRMPIKVFIRPGDSVNGYQPDYDQILVQSFQDWSEASAHRVRFVFVHSAGESDIECTWLDDPRQLENPAEAGEAEMLIGEEGVRHGTVKILTVPLSPQLPLSANRMRQVCMHEIGHVLGLNGHTSNPADAMFYTYTVAEDKKPLTARDGNTLIKLYTLNLAGH